MTAPISEEELAEMERLAKRTKSGDWKFERVGFDDGEFAYEMHTEHGMIQISECSFRGKPSFAKFYSDHIAHMNPERTLRLVNEIKRLRSALKIIASEGRLAGGDDCSELDAVMNIALQALAGEERSCSP